MFISEKYKSTLILSLILLVSFVSVSLINFNAARSSIEEELMTSTLPLLRENIYSEIQRDFTPPLNIASMMAHDSFLINWALSGEEPLEEILQYLQKIHEEYSYLSTFFVSHQSGLYYHYSGINKRISRADEHDQWYFRFVDSGETYDLDVDTDEMSQGVLTIFINQRVEDFDGNFLGVAGVGIRMEDFSRFLRETQEKYHRQIYLVDSDGMVQAHSQGRYIEAINIKEMPGLGEEVLAILTPESRTVDARFEYDGERVLVSSLYMPELDWYLIVEQRADVALASARRNLVRTLMVGLLASVLVILIAAWTVMRFSRKMVELASTDELTRAANRREFELQLQRLLYRFNRYHVPVSLLLIDIDDFKEINDNYGHHSGDQVLKGFAALVQGIIRPDDLLARWGGDEFAVLLEASADDAAVLAGRIIEEVNHPERQTYGGETYAGQVRVSIGVAACEGGDEETSLLRKADRALYLAKESGKNQLRLYRG